jgi:hypothetical protein
MRFAPFGEVVEVMVERRLGPAGGVGFIAPTPLDEAVPLVSH